MLPKSSGPQTFHFPLLHPELPSQCLDLVIGHSKDENVASISPCPQPQYHLVAFKILRCNFKGSSKKETLKKKKRKQSVMALITPNFSLQLSPKPTEGKK